MKSVDKTMYSHVGCRYSWPAFAGGSERREVSWIDPPTPLWGRLSWTPGRSPAPPTDPLRKHRPLKTPLLPCWAWGGASPSTWRRSRPPQPRPGRPWDEQRCKRIKRVWSLFKSLPFNKSSGKKNKLIQYTIRSGQRRNWAIFKENAS